MRRPSSSEAAPPTEIGDWSRLIAAIGSQKDRTAFAQLFAFFAPRIKHFMLLSGASDGLAEDLAQETMLAVWRKATLFDPASTGAAAWIFTIARNLRIDAHRRDQRNIGADESDAEFEFQIDDSPQPDARVAAAQMETRVRSALAQLPEDQLRVVELSFFEEKAHADIARTLGIPLGTVKSRLRLAFGRLRSLLSDMS
jgi:RNA polymerase sigma-70 factor (ECF subfamily)